MTKFDYKSNEIRLSDGIEKLKSKLQLKVELAKAPEAKRIRSLIEGGNKARARTKRKDLLALFAVSEISRSRAISTKTNTPEPLLRKVHILDSLKRPEEVEILRRIYGPGFYLIGIYSTESERRHYLKEDMGIQESEADELIAVDTDEGTPYGQRTRDTFHLADVFVRLKGDEYKKQLWRFLDLVFGHPYETPSREEQAMYLAYAASLRSASLSRQVGAAIVSKEGEVIAVGCNDVPSAGGGLYWPGKGAMRDHELGYDSNDAQSDEIIGDLLKQLGLNLTVRRARRSLEGSLLLDITEYGRAAHAEMEALLSCARSGVSPRDGTLYSTTFPCHNCARHIVAAGITRVFYIEPYPKSYAEKLHRDSIKVAGEETEDAHDGEETAKVYFEPFVGVGPRRFFDLFSMKLSTGYPITRKESGKPLKWDPGPSKSMRVPMLPTSYLQREQLAVNYMADVLEKRKRS